MKFHGKNVLPRAALTAALTMSLGLSQSVIAAEGSGDMDVNAGLTEALSVTCSALNFGTTSIVAGTRDSGTTVVTLANDGTVTGETVGVALDTDTNSPAAAGVCSISGSALTSGNFNASLTSDIDLVAASGVTGPETKLNANTFTTGDLEIGGEGTGDITIGGKLNIPDGLKTANMGDYTATVTVTVDDDG